MEDSKSSDESTGASDFRYYPHRRSGKADPTWKEKLFQENLNSTTWKHSCEKNVVDAFHMSPSVKILTKALNKAGCPINFKRHIVCETCKGNVHGGYDGEYNQIIICKNMYKSRNYPEAVLIHELIHMYDNCVNEFDSKNIEHLACTEVRAANLTHCSFLSSVIFRYSSPFNIKKSHQDCVKMTAANSIMVARNINFDTAMKYVLKVFDKCYNDLEPIGRRFRRNSNDPYLAEEEAKRFLFFDKN